MSTFSEKEKRSTKCPIKGFFSRFMLSQELKPVNYVYYEKVDLNGKGGTIGGALRQCGALTGAELLKRIKKY